MRWMKRGVCPLLIAAMLLMAMPVAGLAANEPTQASATPTVDAQVSPEPTGTGETQATELPRPENAPEMAPSLSQPLMEMPFEASAPSVLLCEAGSGQVVFEKNADEKRPVASVTKLMSLLLVLEALEDGRMSLEQGIVVSKNAAGTGGSQALLDAGAEYPVSDLLKSVIVASANDATVALAETLYGSEEAFVRRMNGRAAELGLKDTVYINSTGLTAEGQHTTARDTARLSMLVLEHPVFFEYSGIWMDELVHPSGRKTELVNTNRLIRTYSGADGVKTGSTSQALYCVSASAMRDGMRLIAVVLGSPTSTERFSTASKMLDYGFDHFYLTEVVKEGSVVCPDWPIAGASVNNVDVVAAENVRALIMKGEEAQISFETQLPETLQAPLAAGEAVGEIVVYKDGEEILRASATIAEDIDEAGFFGSILRVIRAWFD